MLTDRSALRLLLDGYGLRRLRRAFDRSVSEFVVDVEPDPARLALLADPFDSMADVHRRLSRLEADLLEAGDRRSVFATIYTEMTRHTARAIDAGEFRDAAWMQRYLVRFAEYYRRAFRDYERGAIAAVPDPWIVSFGTALRGEALVLQDTFLGVNAHVNYDLALTLSDVGLDPDRPDRYADHTRVNGILRRLVSVQQALLAERYAPGLERIGEAMGELDDMATTMSLATAREQAWRVAVARTDARWLPVEPVTEWLLRHTATGGAYLLLAPTASPATMRALRAIEADEFDLPSLARAFRERARE